MGGFRILLVTPLVGVGGTELITLTLARGLLKRKHQIYMFANDDGFLSKEFKKYVIKYIEGYAYPPKRSICKIIKAIYYLRKCIIHNNIEIVHAQMAWPIPLIYVASMFIRSRRVRTIWHCRGIKDNNYKIVGRLFNYLTDFVITNCNYERKKLLRNGMKYYHVKTINNAPNVEIPSEIPVHKDSSLLKELHMIDDSAIIGSVSRLDPDRGIEYLLNAIPIVCEKFPNSKFIIVGGGLLEKKLVQRAGELGVLKNIIFTGPRRDMERIYSTIDMLVNPILHGKGTGNNNAEAMAFGKPVIGSNIGGMREIVDHEKTGLLVPPRDPVSLANAIIFLISNPEYAHKLGVKGREKVQRLFNIDVMCDEVEKVYKALLYN